MAELRAGRVPAGVNFNASRYRSPMVRLIMSRRDALVETGQVELVYMLDACAQHVYKLVPFYGTGFLILP
ncbi:MAG TPA: hypothetical protein VGN34_03055 [Ktedonobacteraceae bacterium]